jgi:hypothetical protein
MVNTRPDEFSLLSERLRQAPTVGHRVGAGAIEP